MTHVLRAWRSQATGPDRGGPADLAELAELAELGDQALLGLARGGNTAAFAELYERHRVAARRLARRLVRGRIEADDVVAETFTRVLRVLRRGGGPRDGFRVYLLTAVRRTAWYLQNRDGRELALDAADLDRTAGGPDAELAAAERGLMTRAFASLPERWRTVLWHTEVEGEPARQVARILGISPNGVAALAYRARGALTAAYLQAHLAEPPSADCRPFAAKLGGYTADRSRSRERDLIAAHLAGCAYCRERVAELRDVRSSLRAAAAPLLLGPAAVGYLTHAKPAAVVGALIQHSKASAGAAVSGAAASGEAVAQLVSHHGKVGAALAGATLTVAGALGLVATDQSRPEAASPRVVLTVVASAQRSSAGASLGPADRAPAGAEATRSLPPGQATGRSGAFGGSRPAGSGATGQATGTGGPTANDQPGATTSAGSQPGQPSGSGATQPATTTVAPATVAPATSAPGSDPSAGATSSLEPGSTAANPIDSVTPTPSPTATQPTPGPQKER